MHRPTALPQLADTPRTAWARGWWAGVAVGAAITLGTCALLGVLR